MEQHHATGSQDSSDAIYRRFTLIILLIGLFLQLALASRSWVGGDQLHLLEIGWRFATTGELQPFSKMMSGAGANPGGLLQILVGAPLAVVPHFRAPLVPIILFDLIAVLLIGYLLMRALGARFTLIYLGLYWLSPWRIYHSSFLWEPQYMFLPAAVHLWACWRLRELRAFWPSVALSASIIFALQLHNSFALLLCATVGLVIWRRIRLHPGGAIAGCLIGGVTLLPTIVAALQGTLPEARESHGYFGWGLVHVFPVLKGLLYWPRLGSLDIGVPLAQTIYLESSAEHPTMAVVTRGLQALLVVSIVPAVLASWWYFRPLFRKKGGSAAEVTPAAGDRVEGAFVWLRDYALVLLISLLVAAALSPITLQGWQVIVALHAALIPVAAWLDHRIATDERRLLRIGIAFAAIAIATTVTIGTGNRIFRPGALPGELQRDHPGLRHLFDSARGKQPGREGVSASLSRRS